MREPELVRPLPASAEEFIHWEWQDIAPYYQRLAEVELDAQNVHTWLADWNRIASLVHEIYWRLYNAVAANTADQNAAERFEHFIETVYPQAQEAENTLKARLVASRLEPKGMEVPLRAMRAEVELFRAENVPLLMAEQKIEPEYDRIVGAQAVQWDGVETTVYQLLPVYQDPDRACRERAWRLASARELEDRAALNALWQEALTLRLQLAENAGMRLPNGSGDYRRYRWQQLLRLDYTPDDSKRFDEAIEAEVVPAATRIYDQYRARLGYDRLRPWDIQGPQGQYPPVDPPGTPPLHPFNNVTELVTQCVVVLKNLNPELAGQLEQMWRLGLLDLENRKNKSPGGYCEGLEATGEAFILLNAVGIHDDVMGLFHESGHAFHFYARRHLPYLPQRRVREEFGEVASIGMEFLALSCLGHADGGFYAPAEAARARRDRLESSLFFWPYMAVVDSFQHWAYENPNEAMDPSCCDATWAALWSRFMPGVDWTGLEDELQTGWQRKIHIFAAPFYYVEYGLALLGAVSLWRNALHDQKAALAAYRRALALGGTATLRELFAAAGVQLSFEREALREAVQLIKAQLAEGTGQRMANESTDR